MLKRASLRQTSIFSNSVQCPPPHLCDTYANTSIPRTWQVITAFHSYHSCHLIFPVSSDYFFAAVQIMLCCSGKVEIPKRAAFPPLLALHSCSPAFESTVHLPDSSLAQPASPSHSRFLWRDPLTHLARVRAGRPSQLALEHLPSSALLFVPQQAVLCISCFYLFQFSFAVREDICAGRAKSQPPRYGWLDGWR